MSSSPKFFFEGTVLQHLPQITYNSEKIIMPVFFYTKVNFCCSCTKQLKKKHLQVTRFLNAKLQNTERALFELPFFEKSVTEGKRDISKTFVTLFC